MYSASICGHQMDTEFGFYLPNYEDISPSIQSDFVQVLGRDGDVNLTRKDGVVRYNSVDRDLRFEKVTRTSNVEDVNAIASDLRNAFLGEEGRIIFDADSEFYHIGTVTAVDVICEDGGRLVATISVHFDPFRYKLQDTVVTEYITEEGEIILTNLKKPVMPKVTIATSSEMTLSYTINNVVYSVTVASGEMYIDTLVLLAGETEVSITGTGNVTFTYREAKL